MREGKMAERVERKERKPELRFKGFDGEWEECKLDSLVGKISGGGTPSTTNEEFWNGTIPWLQSSDFREDRVFEVTPRKFISKNALRSSPAKLIPKKSIAVVTRVGVGKLSIIPYDYTTSQDILSLSDINRNELFVVYSLYYKLKREIGLVQGTAIKGITKEDLISKKLSVAQSLNEEEVIGSFFTLLDTLITHQQHKYDQLQNLKKAMLEKMFPRNGADVPEIRFKGFEGAWEYREFGEVFYEYSEKDCDDLPPLMIIQGGGTILREKSDRNLMYNKENLSHYKLVNEGDFIVHLRSFEGGLELATNTGIISPAYHTFHGENIDSKFYYSYFRSKRFIDVDLNPHVYGIRDGRSIDIKGMKSIKIPFTNYEEQKAIGEFIDSIDNLISHQQKKLEHLKHLKAALLDKMFVSDGATA